jgi:hypothetical protein
MPRLASVLDDIPAGLRAFAAYAMQALSLLFVVTQHVVYLRSDLPSSHSLQEVSLSVYGAGGPSSLVFVQIAAVLLARRSTAAKNTAAIAVVVFSAAAVEQFLAIFPIRSDRMVWPMGDTGRVIDQLITLSFAGIALAISVALYRAAQRDARRRPFTLAVDRGPFAEDEDPDV